MNLNLCLLYYLFGIRLLTLFKDFQRLLLVGGISVD